MSTISSSLIYLHLLDQGNDEVLLMTPLIKKQPSRLVKYLTLQEESLTFTGNNEPLQLETFQKENHRTEH